MKAKVVLTKQSWGDYCVNISSQFPLVWNVLPCKPCLILREKQTASIPFFLWYLMMDPRNHDHSGFPISTLQETLVKEVLHTQGNKIICMWFLMFFPYSEAWVKCLVHCLCYCVVNETMTDQLVPVMFIILLMTASI